MVGDALSVLMTTQVQAVIDFLTERLKLKENDVKKV